jgi:oxalate decarboxylase/phosphoglucose isomerase-like protein (cupin superfamily)
MHDVTPRVIVWLKDAHFVDSFPDGTSREEVRKSGDAEWVPARRHAGENVADAPMEFIAVVLKPAGNR